MDYFEIYKDVWNLHKKFIDTICDDDNYWQSLVDEASELTKKYGDCKFIRNLVLNELEEIETIYKKRRTNGF